MIKPGEIDKIAIEKGVRRDYASILPCNIAGKQTDDYLIKSFHNI